MNWQLAAPSPPLPLAWAAGEVSNQPSPGINRRGTNGRKKYPRHAVEARELQLEKKSKLLKREMPRRYVVPKRNRTFLSQGEKMRRKARATSFSSLA